MPDPRATPDATALAAGRGCPISSELMPAALVAGHGRVSLLTPDGELLELAPPEAVAMLSGMAPPLVVHAPATRRRHSAQHRDRLRRRWWPGMAGCRC